MNKIKYLLFILGLFICIIQMQAQDQWINFTNNLYITDVVESGEGLWLSSFGGLCFVHTATEEETYYNRGNSDISSNSVNDILLHPNGDLWLTTSGGICTLKDDEFQKGSSRLTGVLRMTPDEKIVVANYDSLYIQKEGFEFERVAYPAYVADIGGLEIDQEGTIYFNAINFFAETYVAIYKDNEWEIISSNFVYESSLTKDSNDKIWYISSEGLFIYENNSLELATTIDSLSAFSIGKLSVDPDNNILIEIETPCPKILKWDGIELTEINFIQGDCEDIRFIKPSSESNKYFANNRKNGLYSFTDTDINEFQVFTQSPIYNNSPLTTLHPSNGKHYVIFQNKIQIINEGNWSDIPLPAQISSQILFADLIDDQLWICDKDFLWFRDGNNWTKIDPPNNFTVSINQMTIGANGDLWLQAGLTIGRYKNETWDLFTTAQHNITASIIKDMAVDPTNGDLWISTFQGVRHYDGETWTSYDFPPVNQTFGLAISDEGVFVRKAGLFLIKENSIDTIPMPDFGYYGPFESEMIYDFENKQLFLSANNHLAVYKNEAWTIYNLENSSVYNSWSNDLNIDTKNNLWLSGSGGGLEIFNEQGVVLAIDNSPSENDLPIEIYPTIIKDNKLMIETKTTGLYQLSVYNVQGQLLKADSLHLQANVSTSFLMPQSNSGTYFLTFKLGNGMTTKKIIRLGN